MPFAEALDKLGAKSPIVSAMTSSEWSDVPVELRERAFFSSEVESARFLQRAQDAISDFLKANKEEVSPGVFALKTGSRAQFTDLMQNFLRAEGVEISGAAGGLRDITSSSRLGLIFSTQVTQANSYGYWRQGMQPDILNEFPAVRFIRVHAVKEPRLNHAPFEEKVFLKTPEGMAELARINRDFGVPWAPFGWGCGHDTEDVDRAEAQSLGLLQRGQRLQPVTKSFNENLQASIKTLDPDLLQKISNVFGQRAVVENDVMRWRSDEEMPQ